MAESIQVRARWAVILTLGLLAGIAAPVRAESVPPGVVRFRMFGSAEGLRNLVVVGVTEDGAGYLWVGTDDGLFRYDGERFTQFAGERGVPSTAVLSVGTDPEGHACAGTNKGLACWNGSRFSRDAALGLPQRPVNVIRTYRGQLWVGTADGLHRRDNGHFTPAPGWTASGPVKALWTDDRGIVVGAGGRVLLGDGSGSWQEIEPGLAGDRVDGVMRDNAGTLWIRSARHMWRLAPGAARAEDVTDGLPPGYDSVEVADSMIDAGNGEVWVGTDVGIARRIDGAWRILEHSGGLPTSGARTLFIDREGTVWVGAIGLLQLRGRGLIERYDRVSGLPGDIAWSFGRDHQGNLWVGTNRCLAHIVGGTWACLAGTENRIVRSFVWLPNGGVFLGGAPSDLLYIDPTGRPTSIEITHAPANDHMFLALRRGAEGDLWIGTKEGLFRLAGAEPGVPQRVIVPGIAAKARFSSLVTVEGQLWSGTSNGIAVLDHGAWHVFDTRDGFRASDVRYLVHRQDGRMCVSYAEAIGITCFATDGSHVSALKHIGTADGMAAGMVYYLGEDRGGRLWVGTGNGLDVLGPGGLEHFSEADGLAGNDAAATAFFEERDGSLWLGSTGGVTRVDAARYTGPPPPPRIVLREGTLGAQAIADSTKALETSHDANALSLAFAAYTHADSVEYQVRLRPLEDSFLTTRVSQIRYPALIANTYDLQVRARIGAGPWGPVRHLGFTVRPAWWESGWFLALAGVCLLGLLAGTFQLRQRAVLSRQTLRLHEQSTAELLALLEALPDLITVHRDGKITYVNDAARRMWCRSPTEIPDIASRTHPDDQAQRNAVYARVQAAGGGEYSETVELRIRDRDDVYRVFEATYSRLKLSGAPVLVVSGRDVTERRHMREQLLLSDRMASLGTLAAGIAHEINNPLSYVIGNLEILEEGLTAPATPPDSDLTTAVRDAADGAQRMRKIIAGLRTFSRSEEEQRVPLQIADVLQSAIRLTANEVRHRAQLVCELGPVPRVVADSGRLAQVFINLIVNAAHAIPEGKSGANRITLRTSTDDQGRAVVAVIDTGRGMPPDVLARAFDPFFTTKDVGAGTGLGLAICHGIISALGGEIGIDSAPEQGTTVWVRLRAAPELVERAEVHAAPEPAAIERLRLMIVDDDPMVADVIARRLRRDHEVIVVSCGSDALAQVQQGAWFDAIISDVMMPNMTGIELLEQLLEVAPRQAERVIFLSGGVFAAESRARLDALRAVLLEKPVDLKDLRAAIAAVAASSDAAPSVAALRNLADAS